MSTKFLVMKLQKDVLGYTMLLKKSINIKVIKENRCKNHGETF